MAEIREPETQRRIIQLQPGPEGEIYGLSEDGNVFVLEENPKTHDPEWSFVIDSPWL